MPGVPLIGPKIAGEYLRKYGTLDELLSRADEVPKGKRKENLIAMREQALLEPRPGAARPARADSRSIGTPAGVDGVDDAALGRVVRRVRLSQLGARNFDACRSARRRATRKVELRMN